jgi:mycoredoxin
MKYWIWLLAFGGMFAFQHRADIRDWIDPPAPIVVPAGFQALLYATATCPYCAKARKLLDARNVPYREIDVDTEEGFAAYEKLHGNGVPILVIRDQVIHGFDRAAIEAALLKL